LPFRDTQAFWVKMPELERLSHYFLHFDMDVASFKKIQFRLSGPGGAVHFVWEAEQGPLPPENAPVRVSLEVAPATARLVADQIAVVQNPPFRRTNWKSPTAIGNSSDRLARVPNAVLLFRVSAGGYYFR
jgi:hypothetical protein